MSTRILPWRYLENSKYGSYGYDLVMDLAVLG